MSIELTQSNILDQDLFKRPFSSSLKSEILNAIFSSKFTASNFDRDSKLLSGYFEFYSDQCQHASLHIFQIANHKELISLILRLQNPTETRASIQEHVLATRTTSPKSPDTDKSVNHTIDLAARLGLMTFVGKFPFDAGQHTVPWTEKSLQDKLLAEFKVPSVLSQRVKLEKLFTAQNLVQIGGIRIEWTSNLADHLRLQNDDTLVSIFHHASFLRLQQDNPIFPKGLIEETLSTLSILFPPHSSETSNWFNSQPSYLNLDPEATKCRHLKAEDRQIEKFTYWHERLGILKQVFDEAEPKSILQWWRDRRRPVQWYNFWLAIALIAGLTFFFGMVQSIEGALQVWKAYHPDGPHETNGNAVLKRK